MVGAAALAAVAGSYLAVRSGHSDALDRPIGRCLAGAAPRRGDRIVAVATDLGSSFGLAGVSTVLAVTGRRRAAREVGLAGSLAWALAQGIKPALGRARPYELGTAARLVSPPAGSSWPSGHAAVAAAMAASLASVGGRPLAPLAAVGAVAVGASRVAVGVHHASDVVAGLGVGVLAAELGRAILRRVPGAAG